MRQFKYKPLWSDDQAAAMTLAGCGVFIFGIFAVLSFAPEADPMMVDVGETMQSGMTAFLLSIVSLMAFGGTVILIGVRKHPYRWQSVGLRRTSFNWLLVSTLIGLFFVPISISLSIIIQYIVLGASTDLSLPAPAFDTVPLDEFALAFIGTALIVPFAEEIFFRGMLYQWIRTRTNFTLGLVISSFIFGVIHFSAISTLSLSLAGALCAIVYEYSGSIWNATAVHAANNGIIVIVSYFVLKTPIF